LFRQPRSFGLFLVGLAFYLFRHDKFTHPNWWIILTPLVFVQLGALAMGLGCIISALSRRFRDFALGVRIALQLLMFGSAIVFPLKRLDPEGRWIFFLNPWFRRSNSSAMHSSGNLSWNRGTSP
jgi:lipopolysaccharide transport system permease protein